MTTTVPLLTPSRSCSPRFATRRRPERDTFGGELAKIAAALGQPFMPWQRMVADVGCEIDPETGGPAYRQVIVTVPRQSGKTTLFLSWQLDRCLSPRWRHPQRSAFTAQSGKDARDKWLDELYPLLERSKVKRLIVQMTRGIGNEYVSFKTGSLIRLLSTSQSSGHSKTLQQAVLDEIWHDADDRREQGLRPAMITVGDAQLLVCSTAGTAASTVYNRKVTNGRLAVAEDSGRDIAYFEWSASDDWDPEDEESYFSFMPALCPDPPCRCGVADGGWRHTVTLDVLRSERQDMDPTEYRRAYGNRPSMSADFVVPPDVWRRVCDPAAKPDGVSRFGLDVAQDRSSAAIVATDGKAIELVDHREGLGWVVDRSNDLTSAHGGVVALDYGGPAGVLADSIRKCDRMAGRDVVQACGGMFDAIVERRVRFRASDAPSDPFTVAVMGAVKKPVGDNWVWSRSASAGDVTPLMAATVAYASDPPPSQSDIF
jgi:hypothetical protein